MYRRDRARSFRPSPATVDDFHRADKLLDALPGNEAARGQRPHLRLLMVHSLEGFHKAKGILQACKLKKDNRPVIRFAVDAALKELCPCLLAEILYALHICLLSVSLQGSARILSACDL